MSTEPSPPKLKAPLEEHQWAQVVLHIIAEHPDWIATTNAAITAGVQARLQQEIDARANAEASLVVCFEAAGKKRIPAQQWEMVRSAIKNSHLIGGSPYAKAL